MLKSTKAKRRVQEVVKTTCHLPPSTFHLRHVDEALAFFLLFIFQLFQEGLNVDDLIFFRVIFSS